MIQDLILHNTISKRAGVFVQLSCGLTTNGLLDVLKLFPDLFAKYFVHNEAEIVTAEKFWNNLILPPNPSPQEQATIEMFKRYLESCSSTGQFNNITTCMCIQMHSTVYVKTIKREESYGCIIRKWNVWNLCSC